MREHIISEIRRLAASNGGTAPGINAFANASGISRGKWRGIYWARWGDAVAEAGLEPNALTTRLDSSQILCQIAELVRAIGRMPTQSDMMLYKRKHPNFPSHNAISAHFGAIEGLKSALRELANQPAFHDIQPMIPAAPEPETEKDSASRLGTVYLLKAGAFYKIGRTDTIERRIREISIAMPQKVELIHTIKTDDPVGIEAYWHRRFQDRRANGEWFALHADDVKAFLKRTFQ